MLRMMPGRYFGLMRGGILAALVRRHYIAEDCSLKTGALPAILQCNVRGPLLHAAGIVSAAAISDDYSDRGEYSGFCAPKSASTERPRLSSVNDWRIEARLLVATAFFSISACWSLAPDQQLPGDFLVWPERGGSAGTKKFLRALF